MDTSREYVRHQLYEKTKGLTRLRHEIAILKGFYQLQPAYRLAQILDVDIKVITRAHQRFREALFQLAYLEGGKLKAEIELDEELVELCQTYSLSILWRSQISLLDVRKRNRVSIYSSNGESVQTILENLLGLRFKVDPIVKITTPRKISKLSCRASTYLFRRELLWKMDVFRGAIA